MVGKILRNDSGGTLLAANKKENVVNDPMEVELLTIFRGLQICIPLGHQWSYY